MSIERDNILVELDVERVAQDRQWGGEDHDDGHGPRKWLQLIERHANRARSSLVKRDNAGYRARLVKIAALCVAALETYDRKNGTP